MIAIIEFKHRKTGTVRLLETRVAGHSDAQQLVKMYRKISASKVRLKALRSES